MRDQEANLRWRWGFWLEDRKQFRKGQRTRVWVSLPGLPGLVHLCFSLAGCGCLRRSPVGWVTELEILRVLPKIVHSETRTFLGNARRLFPGREKSLPASPLMLTTPPSRCGPAYASDLRLSGSLSRRSRWGKLHLCGRSRIIFISVGDQGTDRLASVCPSSSSEEAGPALAAGRKAAFDRSLYPNTLQCFSQRDFDSHWVPLMETGILCSLGLVWGKDSRGNRL